MARKRGKEFSSKVNGFPAPFPWKKTQGGMGNLWETITLNFPPIHQPFTCILIQILLGMALMRCTAAIPAAALAYDRPYMWSFPTTIYSCR